MKTFTLGMLALLTMIATAHASDPIPLGIRIVQSETREGVGLFCTELNQDEATFTRLPCRTHQFMVLDSAALPIGRVGVAFSLDEAALKSKTPYAKWLKKKLKKMIHLGTRKDSLRGMGFALGTAVVTFYGVNAIYPEDSGYAGLAAILMMFVACSNPLLFDYTGYARQVSRNVDAKTLAANDRENYIIRERVVSPKQFERLKKIFNRGTLRAAASEI